MSKQFYATNGVKYWKPNPAYKEQKLAMLADGTLVVLTNLLKEGWDIRELSKEFKYTETPSTEKEVKVEKEQCPVCRGTGQTMEIVDHDENYNSVWEDRQCDRCNGTGYIIKK